MSKVYIYKGLLRIYVEGISTRIFSYTHLMALFAPMQSFQNLRDLIRVLANSEALLTALFERRNTSIRWEDALNLVDERAEKLEMLKDRGLLQQHGDFLELDERFQDFFEQVLEVNIEVNTAYIRESIESLQDNIQYYLNEKSSSRKNYYLRKVKGELRKLYKGVWRNTLDLRRNIEDTYKTEPNYKNKIAKLESYDKKAADIQLLINVAERLCFEKEKLFFAQATDDELNRIKWQLRSTFGDTRHQLVEIQRQVINYLNQARRQSQFIERLRKVKFLKDQFELKEKSSLTAVLHSRHDLIFETMPSYSLPLSLSLLQTDRGRELIRKVRGERNEKAKLKRELAAAFDVDELESERSESNFINLDEIKNGFVASGRELLDFLMQYELPDNPPFDERLTLYCRMIALFPQEIEVSDNYKLLNGVEYALAYPNSSAK